MGECAKCATKFKTKDLIVNCSGKCQKSFHAKCNDMTSADVQAIQKFSGLLWFCEHCNEDLPNMSNVQTELQCLKQKFEEEFRKLKEMIKNMEHVCTNKKDGKSYAQVTNNEVVVLKPKNNEDGNSKKTLEAVQKCVNPLALEIGIKGIRNAKEGGIIIKCDTRADIEKVKGVAEKKLSKAYQVSTPHLKNPSFKIVDIENDMDNENLLKYLKKQNYFLNHEHSDLKVRIVKKMKTKYMAIVDCDPESHRRVMEAGSLYIDWSRCRVFDYVTVYRCYKCGGFGHGSDHCDTEKCLKCASLDHATKDCENETELSHNLQQLSERAKSTTEFIQRLKGMSDKVNENCEEFEAIVSAQCDALIQAIHNRRLQLMECIRQDKEMRVRALKDQVVTCTQRLQQTTALLQFCIEALKETDSSSFLQIGSMLISRVANTDHSWHKEWTAPRVSPHFDLTLDDKSVLRAIDQLNFIQMKPPAAPTIIPEECSAENNSVTVAWQPPPHSHVEGYVLELDDGNGGDFREVYCGVETICTVDGLHFHCMYNARVKAFNSSGEGEYSELIGLQTAEVAWFTFDPILSGPGLQYSEDSTTVTGEGWEHRIALGSVGFSRGVHYWEFTIDKYDADTDPAFGIARIDVARDKMLGKDEKGWAMYIDRQRSWFQHAGAHEQRVEGGIHVGSTIGVLLDLDQHILTFYVNEEPQGDVAFRDLYGVFYPAVSINRGVSVTVHTALDPPSDSDET